MTSIIVVTYNRAHLLEKCLDSILAQKGGLNFELIVVDNASSDGTRDLIKNKYADSIKLISNARRLALVECKRLAFVASTGATIAFTDDDCTVDSGWLLAISRSITDYDGIGGPVLADAGTRFPWWWRRSLDWLIGINPSPNPVFLPLGSNVAFRRGLLDAIVKKTPRCPSPASNSLSPYGEDNFRLNQAFELGYSIGINKNMLVYHFVPAGRLKTGYLIKRSYREGASMARLIRTPYALAYNFCRIFYNPIRFLVTLDINRLLLAVVSVGYLCSFFLIAFSPCPRRS